MFMVVVVVVIVLVNGLCRNSVKIAATKVQN
jgi:hypothetical protein